MLPDIKTSVMNTPNVTVRKKSSIHMKIYIIFQNLYIKIFKFRFRILFFIILIVKVFEFLTKNFSYKF